MASFPFEQYNEYSEHDKYLQEQQLLQQRCFATGPLGEEQYQMTLEKQTHEHEEMVRRELVSRGRGHPHPDVYLPSMYHKEEARLMQTRRRPPHPMDKEAFAHALEIQRQEHEMMVRQQEEETRRAPVGEAFPRMSKGEKRMFPTKGKAPPLLNKEEYAASLRAMIEAKNNAIKADEMSPAAGNTSTAQPTNPYCYPSMRSTAHCSDLYHTVIASGAYPPSAPPRRPSRGRVHTPNSGNYRRVVYCAESVVEKTKALIKARGDGSFNALRRAFKHMDMGGATKLCANDFKWGLFDLGLKLSDVELATLVKAFDLNGDGLVSWDEFLRVVRGPLNERRLALVDQAFRIMDKDSSGAIKINDIASSYNVDMNPQVISGKLTKEQALVDFLSTWDTSHDGTVTKEEFVEYYTCLSASIDNDDYFELMMRNAWRISGGEGWSANTANFRVLVTHNDNSEHVYTISNALGVHPNNLILIRERLVQMGVTNIKKVSLADTAGC